MKKSWLFLSVFILLLTTSCATLLGGPVEAYQKRKPNPGEPQREVRVVALIADLVLFMPGTIVDFATGAIYKPKTPRTAINIHIDY